MTITAFELAQRYVGLKEMPGATDNPAVLAMLTLDQAWPQHDEVPWCSAFVNWVCWHLRLPRSKDLRARSWLGIGPAVPLEAARVGFDVAILNRGGPADPTVRDAPGHVGFFAGLEDDGRILLLGGNQGNAVSIASFPASDILSVRRLWDGA